jgi:hypothetical protein
LTVWNWLAVLAFLIALMSGFNAFLSLRAKFLDWRGVQNKKKFHKRLKQLAQQVTEADELRNPRVLRIEMASRIISFLSEGTFAALLFMAGYLSNIEWIKLFGAIVLLGAYVSNIRFKRTLNNLRYRYFFWDRIRHFLEEGAKKSLFEPEDEKSINVILTSKWLHRFDKERLQEILAGK